MAKLVPIKEEEAYIALDRDIKNLQEKQARYKEKFSAYHKKGMRFKLLTVIADVERFAPPWKTLLYDLLKADYTPAFIKKFDRRIKNEHPPKEVAPSFKVPDSKKSKE